MAEQPAKANGAAAAAQPGQAEEPQKTETPPQLEEDDEFEEFDSEGPFIPIPSPIPDASSSLCVSNALRSPAQLSRCRQQLPSTAACLSVCLYVCLSVRRRRCCNLMFRMLFDCSQTAPCLTWCTVVTCAAVRFCR